MGTYAVPSSIVEPLVSTSSFPPEASIETTAFCPRLLIFAFMGLPLSVIVQPRSWRADRTALCKAALSDVSPEYTNLVFPEAAMSMLFFVVVVLHAKRSEHNIANEIFKKIFMSLLLLWATGCARFL